MKVKRVLAFAGFLVLAAAITSLFVDLKLGHGAAAIDLDRRSAFRQVLQHVLGSGESAR